MPHDFRRRGAFFNSFLPLGTREGVYLLAAGTLAPSVPLGMVATLLVGWAAAAPLVGTAGAALAGINPSALRTSNSSFARVSLLSFKNWRAFSRPWPMRSVL